MTSGERSPIRIPGVKPHSDGKTPQASGWLGARVVWGALAVWTAGWAWLRWTPSGISWHFFPQGAHLLFGGSGTAADGLHLYARHPELQIGPLTFAVVEPLTWLPAAAALATAQVLMTAAGLLALWLVAPLAARDQDSRRDSGSDSTRTRGPGFRFRFRSGSGEVRVLLAGLVVLPFWTVLSVRWTHPDDVLAILLAAAAVRAIHARRGSLAGLALAGAIAAKPWAVGFTPMLLALPASALAGAIAAASIAVAAAWLPFLLADSGTISALRPPVLIADTSVLRLVGITGQTVPGWTRTAQFLLAPAAALLAVVRGRWAAVPLVAIAVRLALDPQDIGYYTAGALIAAALADLACSDLLLPWATIVTAVLWWHPFVVDFATRFTTAHGISLWWFQHPSVVASAHLAWSAAAVALLFVPETVLRHAEPELSRA